MTPRSKLSAALLLALTAVAGTGFAYKSDAFSNSQASAKSVTPAATPIAAAPAADDRQVAPAANDTSTAPPASERPAVADMQHYSLPPVTVTAPRPSDDELLRNAVMDRIAADARLAGLIGVEAYRHTVSLTGRVTTTDQVERAGMIARSVEGVWNVNNYLHARVGMS